jgi:hypothetical protein
MPQSVYIPEKELLNYYADVPAATFVQMVDRAKYDGIIYEVEVHFPDGCNGLVGVAIYQQGQRFMPRDGYLALNNTTRIYPFGRQVKQTDDLMVEIVNGDGGFNHILTVTILCERAGVII